MQKQAAIFFWSCPILLDFFALIQIFFSRMAGSSSVIRQKGESENGGNKKVKHAKFSEKGTFITHWYALLSSYLRFEIRPFALLPTSCNNFCIKS